MDKVTRQGWHYLPARCERCGNAAGAYVPDEMRDLAGPYLCAPCMYGCRGSHRAAYANTARARMAYWHALGAGGPFSTRATTEEEERHAADVSRAMDPQDSIDWDGGENDG